MLELTYSVIDQQNNHQKMYHFLKRLMKLMNEGMNPEILSIIFELKLLHFLGYGLNFKGCTQCDSRDLVFSVSDGGLICNRHAMPSSATFDEKIYIHQKWNESYKHKFHFLFDFENFYKLSSFQLFH